MKVLFFLVALINVAFFMWEFNTVAFEEKSSRSDKVRVGYEDTERIILVSELETEQNNFAPDLNVSKNTDGSKPDSGLKTESTTLNNTDTDEFIEKAGSFNCYEAGPFDGESVYDVWSKQLISSGAQINSFSKEEKSVEDFLVYYPAAETMAQSQANLQMLKNQGLKDFWIVNKGSEKGQILLGVFTREERAVKMKNQLLAKGLKTEIRARYSNKVRQYALIKGGSNISADLDSLKKTYPAINVNTVQNGVEGCLFSPMNGNHSVISNASENTFGKPAEAGSPNMMAGLSPNSDKNISGMVIAAQDAARIADKKRIDDDNQPNPDPADPTPETPDSFENSDKTSTLNSNDTSKSSEPQYCYEAGPFVNENQVVEWNKQLAAVAADIKLLAREGQSASDYVVYYPAGATMEQSEANFQMLKSKGLADLWMLRAGTEKGQISLGVFNKEERALLMKQQMGAKGIKAEVKTRYKSKMQQYALIKGGNKVADKLKTMQAVNAKIRVKPINNCTESRVAD